MAVEKVELSVHEFEEIQEKLSAVNQKAAKVEGQVEHARKSLQEILDKYKVKNLKEFKELVEKKEAEAAAVLSEATKHIEETEEKLTKLDEILMGVEENGSKKD